MNGSEMSQQTGVVLQMHKPLLGGEIYLFWLNAQAVWIFGKSCSLKKGVAGWGKEVYVLFIGAFWSDIGLILQILSLLSYSSE